MRSIKIYIDGIKKRGFLGRKMRVDTYLPLNFFEPYAKWTEEAIKEKYAEIRRDYDEIRLHSLWGARIGETASQYIFASMDIGQNKRNRILDLFVLYDYKECNSFFIKLMGRHINIVTQGNFLFWRYALLNFPRMGKHSFYNSYNYRDKRIRVFPEDTEHLFELTEDEYTIGHDIATKMGITGDFICFASRDPLYLDTTMPGGDFHYHDYRDSSIDLCDKAVDYLESIGIQSVHLGKHVAGTKIENCIKYAENYYNDFMDFYLSNKCKFFLCDCGGINMPALSMGTPVATKNLAPINSEGWGIMPYDDRSMFIIKKYYHQSEKRYLTIKEILEMEKDFDGTTGYYDKRNIVLEENSREEIAEFVKEMNARIDGVWEDSKEDDIMQKKFQSLMKTDIIRNEKIPNACVHMRIATTFLRRNMWLLEDV